MEPASAARKNIEKMHAAADAPILIESHDDLSRAGVSWSQTEILGIDTEFLRERTYWAKLGLIQVSDAEHVWLIDPLAIPDLEPLADIFTAASTEKVLHSGSEDFEVLDHEMGCVPAPVIDTQVACALLGQPLQLGYHHAVNWLLNVELSKDHTRSNWLKRPLTEGQLRYAALDVVFLPLMAKELQKRLETVGRWEWMREDVERTRLKSTETLDPDDAWSRIRGVGSLDEEGFAVLVELAKWRECEAQARDIARGFLVSDAGLLELARHRPENKSEFANIDTIHPKAAKRFGHRWLEIIRSKPRVAQVQPKPDHFTARQRKLLKLMKQAVSTVAADLGIDQALLASNKELHQMIRVNGDPAGLPDRFEGWRKEVIAGDLIAIMGG